MTIKRAGIILNCNNSFLLVKSNTNKKWSFPKGCIEPDENELVCALRELKEETGVDIDMDSDFYHDKRIYGDTIYFYYKTNRDMFNSKFIFDKNEILAVNWFNENELRNMEYHSYNFGIKMFLDNNKKRPKLIPTRLPDKDGWITI